MFGSIAAIAVGVVIAVLVTGGSTKDAGETLALHIDAAPRAIDAAIADAAPEIEIEAPRVGSGSRQPAAGSRPPPPAPPGHYSIDSRPYATIFIDGKRRDQTPLFRVELSAGRHAIKAVLADGRTRSFAIRIDPGKDVSSGTLTW